MFDLVKQQFLSIEPEQVAKIRQNLNFPAQVDIKLAKLDDQLEFHKYQSSLEKLLNPTQHYRGLAELELAFSDPTGMSILACFVRSLVITKEAYQISEIPEDIFWHTMSFFPRFIKNHYLNYGSYRFTESSWVSRLIFLREFRIQELEFELVHKDTSYISVHIPADANLNQENLHRSYQAATEFFKKFFPEIAEPEYHCFSWMLCPILPKILPETSKIVQFQKDFELYGLDYNADFKRWVFPGPDVSLKELPERTLLQRKLKEYLLAGGIMSSGYGRKMLA